MTYAVFLTNSASADLSEIDDYVAANDSIERADYVLNKLEEVVQSLAELPDRGHFPAELLSIGIQSYREIEWKTHRVIYRIDRQNVHVYVIASARRDFQALLQRRLLSQ